MGQACQWTHTVIATECATFYGDSDTGAPNPIGGINPGGGGSPGGGGGGTIGWNPVPPVTPSSDPCNPFITSLQSNAAFKEKFRSLFNTTNNNYETGYKVNNLTTGRSGYIQRTGIPNTVDMDWGFNTGDKIAGLLHSHANNGTVLSNSIFSMDDLVFMAFIDTNSLAVDSSNFFMGMVSSYGVPYMLKVTNYAKFHAWVLEIRDMRRKMKNGINVGEERLNRYIKEGNEKFKSGSDIPGNEIELLRLLKDKLKGSVTLYEGNTECSHWTEKYLTSDAGNPAHGYYSAIGKICGTE